MVRSGFLMQRKQEHIRNLAPEQHTEQTLRILKAIQAADALKTIEELLNIYQCPTFSPNIEVMCMRRVQREAQRKLEDEIHKAEIAHISEEVRTVFLQSLKQSWQEVTNKILGENIQNDHNRDHNRITIENNVQLNLVDTARIITQQKTNLEIAIRDEAKKKDEETQAAVQKQAEFERIAAQKAEEVRLAMEDALHCGFDYSGALPVGQQSGDGIVKAGDIDHDRLEYL